MPKRQDHHQHGVLVEAADRAAQSRVQHVIVVRARNDLRQRRRAARQQHGRHLGRIGMNRCERCARRGRGEQQRERALAAGGLAGHEHRRERRRLRRELGRHGAVIETPDDVRDDVSHGARGAQEMRDFGVPVRAQRRDRNGADAHEREIRVDKFGNVRELNHHAIARPQARVEKSAGEPVDGLAQCAVADPPAAVHERGLVRRAGRRARQHVGQRDALPIAEIAVALRKLCGPRRAGVEHGVIPSGRRI